MNKQEFKERMSAYRSAVSKAARRGINEFIAAKDSDSVCRMCVKPTYLPVVSRDVMLHLFSKGGLVAVSHIDNVKIKYN